MQRTLGDLLISLLLGLGTIPLASPFLLWWIHESYERYVWVISGPYSYDNLGGGPFRVMVYSGLFATGFVLTSIAPMLRSLLRDPS